MTTPVPWDPPEAETRNHQDCGTCCGDACTHAFVPGAPGLPTLNNATAEEVADAINRLAVPGLRAFNEYPDDINGYLDGYVPFGDIVMAGVRVNSWDCSLNPNGHAEHWGGFYSTAIDWFNCWENRYERTDAGTLQACYMAAGTFVGVVRIEYTGRPQGTGRRRSTTEEDDDVLTAKLWDWPQKASAVGEPTRQQLVWATGDGNLVEVWFDGTRWNGPAALGGAGAGRVIGGFSWSRSGGAMSGQYHLSAQLNNGHVGHWFQGDADPRWDYDEPSRANGAGPTAVPTFAQDLLPLIHELRSQLASLRAAIGGGASGTRSGEVDATADADSID